MILKALLLGLSTGIHCLGYCYPVVAPIMLSQDHESIRGSAGSLVLFLLGRLLAYVLVGLAVGVVGRYLSTVLSVHNLAIPILYMVLGCVLVSYAVVRSFPHWSLCRLGALQVRRPGFLFIVGFLAGINVCPPFLLALGYAVTLDRVLGSMLFFVVFFAATSVYMLPLAFSRLLTRFGDIRVAARFTAVLAGLWFAYQGIRGLSGL